MAELLPKLPTDMPWPTPLIELPTITIRPVHPSDAAAMAEHGNNPKIAETMTDRYPTPYTYMDAVSFTGIMLNAQPATMFALSLTPTSPLIGTIAVKWDKATPNLAHCGELGYWISEKYWGRGIGTTAIRAFVDWLFKDVGEGGCSKSFEKIVVQCVGHNGASAAVAKKAGFTFEGRLRQAFKKKDKNLDLLCFGLLKEEWEEQRQQQK